MTRITRATAVVLAGLTPLLLPPSRSEAQAQFVPLYRWWSPVISDHFYTTDATFEPSPESGYTPEGITGYVATAQVPKGTSSLENCASENESFVAKFEGGGWAE